MHPFAALCLSAGLLIGSLAQAWAQDARDLAAALTQSVGRVIILDRDGRVLSTGSGYALSEDANGNTLFLTNQHVIDRPGAIAVMFGTLEGVKGFTARVLNQSVQLDMAVLQLTPLDNNGFRPMPLPLANHEIPQGEEIYAIGFPGAADRLSRGPNDPSFYDTVLTRGIVGKRAQSSWRTGWRELEILQHDATLNPGNSGGPLMTQCGTVAGLNTAGHREAAGTYWSSSSRSVKSFLDASGVETDLSGPCATGPDWRYFAGGGLILAAAVGATLWMRPSGGSGARPASVRPLVSSAPKSDGALLRVALGDRRIALTSAQLESGVTIGRSREAGLSVADERLSRVHALLKLRDRRLYVHDLGSTNGTTVDDRPIAKDTPVQINTNSRIKLGGLPLSLSRPERTS